MLTRDHLDMVGELRDILGRIPGAKQFQERVTLTFLLVVENDESKETATQVTDMLEQQAKNNGVDLEIVVFTQDQYDVMQSELAKAATENLNPTFKFQGD